MLIHPPHQTSWSMMELWIAAIFFLMGSCPQGQATVEHSIRLLYYNFTTCNAYGQFGPTVAECRDHYEEQFSPIASRLTEDAGDLRGVQYFVVPEAGRYVVTAAGARGGKGVCTRWPGLSPMAQLTIALEKDAVLEVVVGQMGRDACDNNVNGLALCDMAISNIEEALNCSRQWESLVPTEVNMYDGGGGAGGGTLLRHTGDTLPIDPIVLVGGGGGESGHFPNITEEQNVDRVAEKNGQETQGFSPGPGTRPVNAGLLTAGRGSGNKLSLQDGATAIDGKSFGTSTPEFAQGGRDCYTFVEPPAYFPETYGGYGGGGGGCGNGPGGGGYQGGAVRSSSNSKNGQGGFLYPSAEVKIVGYNSDHGFVSLRLENCGCAQNCSIDFERSVFTCSCHESTALSPDGFDCHRETDLNFNSTSSLEPLSTFSEDYGQIILTPLVLDRNYSVNIVGLSLSLWKTPVSRDTVCGVILTDPSGNIVAVVQDTLEPASGSLIERATLMDSCCGNASFTVSSPVVLLNGSVEVVGGYIYHSEGSTCDIMNVRANISIREGMPLGSPAAINGSLLPAFFVSLYGIKYPPTPTPTPTPTPSRPSLVEEYIWWIVGAMGGATLALILILLILLVTYVIVRHKRRRSLMIVREMRGCVDNTFYNLDPNDHSDVVMRVKRAHEPRHLADTNSYATVKSFKRKSNVLSMSLNMGDDFLKSKSLPREYAELTVPNYGVEVPQGMDFSKYNQKRVCKSEHAWYFARDKLTYMRELGEGEFGKVLLMLAKNIAGYSGNLPVAVKTLSRSKMKEIDKFMQEVDLMKKFSHPNIVSLLGVCPVEEDAAPMMILELMPYGDLHFFLQANRPEPNTEPLISVVEFYQFATHIAVALEFLASQQYVHRDVAARNCLVGNELVIKLADFGMARHVRDKDCYRVGGKARLPVKWMAPESLLYGEFSEATDVWAYGILLWEIASYGESPLQEYDTQAIIKLAEDKVLSHCLPKPENCPEEYYTLIQNCLSHVASDRPTFADITALLGAYSNEEFRLEEVERDEMEDTIRCTTTNLSPVEEVPEIWTLVTNTNNNGEYSNDTQGSEEDWCQESDIDYQINGGACAAGGRKGSIVTAGSSQDSLTPSTHASRISLV